MVLKQKGVSVGNTFLESLNRKCSSTVTNFVLGSAQSSRGYPIIYCSDGFCKLTGFGRQEVLGCNCDCSLLCSMETSAETIMNIKEAMRHKTELKTEIYLSKKDGTPFKCLLDIVPIRNEAGDVVFFLISHKEIADNALKLNGITTEPRDNVLSEKPATTNGTKVRRFSRDVLLHFHKRYYGPSSQMENIRTAGNVESQLLPEYKLEDTVIPKRMLLHFGRLRLIWDWIILIIVSYQAIVIPFIVSFEVHRNVKFYVIDAVLELMFIFDIILNFRTTYINQRSGRLVTSPKEIAMHYVSTWFAVDFVATFPFDLLYFICNDWSKIINMLKLKRLLRLFRFGRRISKYIEYTTTLILLMMFSFALLSHWLACIWYVIGYKEVQVGEMTGWLYRLGRQINKPYTNRNNTISLAGPSRSEEYISSLYFVFTSLTTVGFGNISPNTVAEKIFSIIVLMLGAIVQSAIFGNMTAVIQKLYASRARFHAKASQIKQFVHIHDIDGDLKKRIEDWFISHWSISKGVNTEEMLESFPNELQADICLHLYKGFLTLPCFVNSSRGCLRSISVKVKKAYYSPGELIIKERDALNSLLFVQRGTVEIVQRDFIAAILGTGDLFGEDICQSQEMIKCSNGDVKALMYCEILYITRDGIKDVITCYPGFPKTFSKDLVLSYDLSRKQMNLSDERLGPIVEEEIDQECDTRSVTSSSSSSSSEESDSNGICKGNNRKSTSIKRRSTRRSASSGMPLWQLKLTNEKRESPTPSVKTRMRKLNDLNTSSNNDGDDSEGDVSIKNNNNNSINNIINNNSKSNNLINTCKKSSSPCAVYNAHIDFPDQVPAGVETTFIRTNNNISSSEFYEDVSSKPSNLFLNDVITNGDTEEKGFLTSNIKSNKAPNNDSFIYRNKSAVFQETDPISPKWRSSPSPTDTLLKRKPMVTKKINMRKQLSTELFPYSYNNSNIDDNNDNDFDDDSTQNEMTSLRKLQRQKRRDNELSANRDQPHESELLSANRGQVSIATNTTNLPSLSPARDCSVLQKVRYHMKPCTVVIESTNHDSSPMSNNDPCPLSDHDLCLKTNDTGQSVHNNYQTHRKEKDDEVEEDGSKDRLGFFISDQAMSNCSGYSSFYEKSENELDHPSPSSFLGNYYDETREGNDLNTLGSWVNEVKGCTISGDITDDNENDLDVDNETLQLEDKEVVRLLEPISCGSSDNVKIVEVDKDFNQMKNEINSLRNEMQELKSGMNVLTELVRLSLNSNYQLQKNL